MIDGAAERIRTFLAGELLEGLPPGVDPLAAGMLDSLATEQLGAFVEDAFDIELDDHDFSAENFASIEALVALVEARVV